MFVALAAEMGVGVPSPSELAEIATAPPSRPANRPSPATPPAAATAADGLRLAIAANVFAGGGTARFDERIAELRPGTPVLLAPQSAAALGVAAGDVCDLMAGERGVRGLRVQIDAAAPPNVATIVEGIPDAQANALVDGESVVIANVRKAPVAAGAGSIG